MTSLPLCQRTASSSTKDSGFSNPSAATVARAVSSTETYKDVANPAAGVIERIGVLAEYTDKFLYLRDVVLRESIPVEALRSHDARDRFAVILPRHNSFVRHRAHRPVVSPAVGAMIQETTDGAGEPARNREGSLVGG